MCFYAPSYFFDVRPLCFYSRHLYVRPSSTFLSIVSFCPTCLYFYGGDPYFCSRRLLLCSSVYMPIVYFMPVRLSLKFVVCFYAPCLSLPSSLSLSLSFKSHVFLFAYRLSSPSCDFLPVCIILPAVCFYAHDLHFVPRHLLLWPSSGFLDCRLWFYVRRMWFYNHPMCFYTVIYFSSRSLSFYARGLSFYACHLFL